MSSIALSFNNVDLVSIDGGEPKTTSLAVAKKFGKRHANVLQAIDNIECSDTFKQLNFKLVMESMTYVDKHGASKSKATKRVGHALMTKDGFIFLVMGFTGKKAAEFKEDYINEFNRMTDKLNGNIGTLIERHNTKSGILKKGKAIASDSGYNLWFYGQVVNPKTATELKEIEKELQPLLTGFNDAKLIK